MTLGYPDTSINSSGKLAVVFPEVYSGIKQIYIRVSTDYGDTWGAEEKITSSVYNCDNPAVVVDEVGNISVIFEELYSNVIPRLYEIHKLVNETSWSTPIAIDATASPEYPVALEFVPNGGFDTWVGDIPTYWSVYGSPTTVMVIAPVFNAPYCLGMNSSNASNYVYQNIDGSLIRSTLGSQPEKYLISVAMRAYTGSKAAAVFELVGGKILTLETEHEDIWEVKTAFVDQGLIEGNITIKLYQLSGPAAYWDSIIIRRVTNDFCPQRYPNIVSDDDFRKGHVNILYAKDKSPVMDLRIKSHNIDGGANITDDVQSLRVSRDKEFKTGIFGAGDFSLTLDNTSGIYTNEKTDSPFYKKLKSGVEVTVELGVREYVSGELSDPSNWTEELFPSIIGIASKFSNNSRNELFSISGRDRADRFMNYRNFTSPLYESKQALELIEELVNEDLNGDGFGDIDLRRPFIPLSQDTSQQTLSAWDRKLLSGSGSTIGDAGSVILTADVYKEINIKTYHATVNYFIAAWVDRSVTGDDLWTISSQPAPGGLLVLDQWQGWKTEDDSLVHVGAWDITSLFPDFIGHGAPQKISVTNYDDEHDCVWVQYYWWDSGASLYRLDIAKFDFKTRTYTFKYRIWSHAGGVGPSSMSNCGGIIYDPDNQKLWLANFFDRLPSGNTAAPLYGPGWPRYGVYSISPTEVITQDFFNYLQDDGDGTPLTGYPATVIPTCGVKFGDYYYFGCGYQYLFSVYENHMSFGAMNDSFANLYDIDLIAGNTGDNWNTAMCWVTHPYGPTGPAWDQLLADAGTGEAFFDSPATQRKPILSMDYDSEFLYLFCTDNQSGARYGTSGVNGPIMTSGIEVRRCASRVLYLPHTNLMALDHTIAQGYTENDTDYIWFSYEQIKAENEEITDEMNYSNEYDSEGVFVMTGLSDQTSGTPLMPTEDYHINLETGELLLKCPLDKENIYYASYDYKYSVPYAWFEDTSIWDAIQEIASAGDFVCYVNESGELVFKDRFKYYYALMSDYEATLSGTMVDPHHWTGGPSFCFEDADGDPITNIIPGLEFVMSMNPDKVTGKFTIYKRQSYFTNGIFYEGTSGDYDINYDTGEIGWLATGNIKVGERVMIYFYNRPYLFNFSYDSNILDLNYQWGADTLANRVTVKGERYYPSESPISIREAYVVNPGDRVVSTKFSSVKQLSVGEGVTDISQNQFDDYARVWRDQEGSPQIDFEFRTKTIGDSVVARAAGKAIQVRVIPCRSPAIWVAGNTAPNEVPDSEWVGNGYKINWSSMGDTGLIPQPNDTEPKLHITGIDLEADGLVINVDHLERDTSQYFVQVEIIGYTLTRVAKFTAMHEDYASMLKYFTRSYEIENKFISDIDMAKLRARLLAHFLSEERPEVDIEVLGSPFIELEDVVSVKDLNSGLSGDYFEVTGIEHDIIKDNFTTKLTLRKICEITTYNLAYNNPIEGYGGGLIDKTAMPIETFVEQSEGYDK